jgi:hypothetical protein
MNRKTSARIASPVDFAWSDGSVRLAGHCFSGSIICSNILKLWRHGKVADRCQHDVDRPAGRDVGNHPVPCRMGNLVNEEMGHQPGLCHLVSLVAAISIILAGVADTLLGVPMLILLLYA